MSSIYTLVAARHGRFFVNRGDTYIGQSLQRYGEWSEAEITLFGQFVRAGDTVVEAGANIGSHTVWLSKQVGDAGCVHAFEPARHTFQLLCANLVANDCLNVRAAQQAVGHDVGSIAFPLLDPRRSWNFGGASLKKNWTDASETVACTTLDALELPALDLIKADVEGFELEVLAGARDSIARHRPVVYLEINGAAVRDGAVALLEPLGYSCWYFITPMFSPDNWLGQPEDIFKDYSFDLLCLPDEGFTVEGMARAGVADGTVSYSATEVRWATPAWQSARVTRKP